MEGALDPYYHYWPGAGPTPSVHVATVCGQFNVPIPRGTKMLCPVCHVLYANQRGAKSVWPPGNDYNSRAFRSLALK